MMPLYPINSLRSGMRFQQNDRALPPGIMQLGHGYRPGTSEISGDDEEDHSEAASESVRSVPSPTDDADLYDLARSNLSEEYPDYLQDDLVHQASSEDEPGSPVSGSMQQLESTSGDLRPRYTDRYRDLGLADSELSDAADYLHSHEGDDESHGSESSGELTNLSNEDRDDDPEDDYDEVPIPPQLPAVPEERLQEVWPLGDASFSIFLCPITHDVMTDPVAAADGYTYERVAIARWFETSRKSPVTGQTLPHTELVPNHSVRTLLKTLIDMTDKTGQPVSAADTLSSLQQRSANTAAPAQVMPPLSWRLHQESLQRQQQAQRPNSQPQPQPDAMRLINGQQRPASMGGTSLQQLRQEQERVMDQSEQQSLQQPSTALPPLRSEALATPGGTQPERAVGHGAAAAVGDGTVTAAQLESQPPRSGGNGGAAAAAGRAAAAAHGATGSAASPSGAGRLLGGSTPQPQDASGRAMNSNPPPFPPPTPPEGSIRNYGGGGAAANGMRERARVAAPTRERAGTGAASPTSAAASGGRSRPDNLGGFGVTVTTGAPSVVTAETNTF